jgi:hypothetical protein
LVELAAQSGAPIAVLKRLRERLAATAQNPPATVLDWMSWIFTWLTEDAAARLSLLRREKGAILGAVGRKVNADLTAEATQELLPGVNAWLTGRPIKEIEQALGGDPQAKAECPRARRLITSLVPLGLTFVAGLVARTAQGFPEFINGAVVPRYVLETLSTAVRRGFDDPAKLAFSEVTKGLHSRVQYHRAFGTRLPHGLTISSTQDYTALVALMRFVLQ